jgi:hypothetical protein
LNIKRKFGLAVVAYAALGVLAWQTLSNEPIHAFGLDVSLRGATLAIVGVFALRTLLYFWRVRIEEARESSSEASE